jgi:hypothetical protein
MTSTVLKDDLPETLRIVRTRLMFAMRLDVRPMLDVGTTPGPYRRIGVVPSGVFEGERLSGQVLDGGKDWPALEIASPLPRFPRSQGPSCPRRQSIASPGEWRS